MKDETAQKIAELIREDQEERTVHAGSFESGVDGNGRPFIRLGHREDDLELLWVFFPGEAKGMAERISLLSEDEEDIEMGIHVPKEVA